MLVPPYLGKSCGTGWHQIIGQLAIMRDSLTCSYSILTYIITTVLTGGAYPKCKLHFFNFSRCFLRPWTCNFTFWSYAKNTLPTKGAIPVGRSATNFGMAPERSLKGMVIIYLHVWVQGMTIPSMEKLTQIRSPQLSVFKHRPYHF